jgi:hypothetical protein
MSHWYDKAYERVNRLSQIVTFVDRRMRTQISGREDAKTPNFVPKWGFSRLFGLPLDSRRTAADGRLQAAA